MRKRLFTWANWSVHGLGRWYTKFRTRKFRPGIAFITKKRPRRPEPGIKDGFDEMGREIPFGIFRPEKQDYLFRRSIATGHFQWNDPKSRAPFTFQTDFLENFGKW